MQNLEKPRVVFDIIEAEKILNVNQHVDGGWFWTKYSANPYLGCQFGCSYCFLREDMYGLNVQNEKTKNMEDSFSQYVRVRMNAPELLEKELKNVPKDLIVTGDYQPAEAKFGLSRKMLEVCHRLKFPVIVLSKSPLILRDMDIIKKISEASWACVVFSISSSQSKGFREIFEPYAPSFESRFYAMKKFSENEILTGTAFMPILPYVNDSDENLEGVVRKTKENGGKFVLAGGLVMSDSQAEFLLKVLEKNIPGMSEKYKKLYGTSYSPQDDSWSRIGKKVKILCAKYGLDYRLKRYVPEGPLAVNKKIVEKLFLKIYEMEIENKDEKKIWEYRNAAWFVDELETPLGDFEVEKLLSEDNFDEKIVDEIKSLVKTGTQIPSMPSLPHVVSS